MAINSLLGLFLIKLMLTVLSFLLPKPNAKWITITRWNPEISYSMAYVSQLIFPILEIIFTAVILIAFDDNTYNWNGPLVFGLIIDVGIIV